MERQGGSPAPGRGFMEDINLDFSEDLFDNIDDLLDFPTQPDSILGLRFGGGANDDDSNVSQGVWQPADQHFSTSFFPNVDNTSNASSTFFQLSVPEENVDQLEWVATFVDNSFFLGEGNQHIDDHEDNNNNSNSRSTTNQDEIHQLQIPSPVSVLESSSSCSGGGGAGRRRTLPISPETIVPGRARSKRGRPVTYSNRGHHRSLVSPTSSIADSEFIPHLLSFVSPTHSSSCCLPSKLENFAESNNPLLSTTTKVVAVEENNRKKKNKLTPVSSGSRSWQLVGVRKCLHCEITKTPQWRAGPLGPKTLCNACGVRHKSGRLFPEYRPAASPTFVPKLHSNSHKRVIEMRSSKTSSSSSSSSDNNNNNSRR